MTRFKSQEITNTETSVPHLRMNLEHTISVPAPKHEQSMLHRILREEEGGITAHGVVWTFIGMGTGAGIGAFCGSALGGSGGAEIGAPVGAFLGSFLLRKPWAIGGTIIGAGGLILMNLFEGGSGKAGGLTFGEATTIGAAFGLIVLRRPRAIIGAFVGSLAFSIVPICMKSMDAVKMFVPIGAFLGGVGSHIIGRGGRGGGGDSTPPKSQSYDDGREPFRQENWPLDKR